MSDSGRRGTRIGWLAAEFLVVVLGVVVGLAVDSWRQSRSDVALEVGYLERLKDDLEADTARFDSATRLDARRDTLLTGFLAIVDGTAPFPAEHLAVLDGLTAALMASFDTPRRATYDELINQADLGRVGNADTRRRLAEYHAWVTRDLTAQYPEWQADAERVEVLFVERLPPIIYRWTQAASHPELIADRSRPTVTVSREEVRALVEAVRRDPELKNLLYRQSRIQSRLAAAHAVWKMTAVELLEILDGELARIIG